MSRDNGEPRGGIVWVGPWHLSNISTGKEGKKVILGREYHEQSVKLKTKDKLSLAEIIWAKNDELYSTQNQKRFRELQLAVWAVNFYRSSTETK